MLIVCRKVSFFRKEWGRREFRILLMTKIRLLSLYFVSRYSSLLHPRGSSEPSVQSKCWSQNASVSIHCGPEAQRNIPFRHAAFELSVSFWAPSFDVVLQYISSSFASQSTTPSQTWCRSRHKVPHSKQLFFIWFILSSETFISFSSWSNDFLTRFNAFSHLCNVQKK